MIDADNNRDIYSISRLNSEVRSVLDNSFPLLWVNGEISNLTAPKSGHLYLTLKDQHSQVRCALFRNKRQLLRFKPASGDQVLVRARIGFYEPRGDFQLIIEHMEPLGDGAAQQAFEALKKKLQAEGLFDTERKKPLPRFPHRIGIITSPSGAAVQDILKVLKRRAPNIPVIIYPSQVQGDTASQELIKALKLAEERAECDILLLTRGGGSSEDLYAFNDEKLARTVAELNLPVVSAVGHEIDFTITDFVADRRAPTPSAAAELISPDRVELDNKIETLQKRLNLRLNNVLSRCQQNLSVLDSRLKRQDPILRLQQQQQRVDELDQRMARIIRGRLLAEDRHVHSLNQRLDARSPKTLVENAGEKLRQIRGRLGQTWHHSLQQRHQRLSSLARELNAVSPLSTLDRGYAIISKPDTQEVVRESSSLKAGDRIEARLHQGHLVATVDEVN